MNRLVFSYSLTPPSYMQPKLFSTQKTEEYFVTSLYAQYLFYNNIPVIGVEVCDDDSDKQADSIIKLENDKKVGVQVTRFNPTEYLTRLDIARKRILKIINEINKIEPVSIPLNVTFNFQKYSNLLPNKAKYNVLLAKEITGLIKKRKHDLEKSENIIVEIVENDNIKKYIPLISFQRIPINQYSCYFGKDNIYINPSFDNVSFSPSDIDIECKRIYDRKNEGLSDILLIWADSYEIVEQFKPIAENLEKYLLNSSFKEVLFLKFQSSLPKFQSEPFEIAHIKENKEIYK